jgi:hypothetical protein
MKGPAFRLVRHWPTVPDWSRLAAPSGQTLRAGSVPGGSYVARAGCPCGLRLFPDLIDPLGELAADRLSQGARLGLHRLDGLVIGHRDERSTAR